MDVEAEGEQGKHAGCREIKEVAQAPGNFTCQMDPPSFLVG